MHKLILKSLVLPAAIAAMILMLPTGLFAQQTLPVNNLTSRPRVDGSGADWKSVPAAKIPLEGELGIKSVDLKAGVYGNEVFFLLQWSDSTEDVQHKPFIWNAAKKKYVGGKQKEDRIALQFEMEGDYTTNWISGKLFKADTWHWKSARTNPNSLAHDKMTIITATPAKKSYKSKAEDGTTIYILRPSDQGSKLYKSARYSKKDKDMMPKYILAQNAQGSVADVKAKGVWRQGKWTLEFGRKLNTGHPDDVVFRKGQAVKGGIAVFNRSGDEHHDVSKTLVFQF